MNKFFVTTPLYYVNDVPHVGHAYTTITADVIARYWRQKLGKKNVFFLTGTDEHGSNVAQAAEKAGKSPKEYADEIAPRFAEAWKLLNIDYDFFIRTTDPRHEKIAREVLQKIYDNGWIYEGLYEGFYCVGCEKFITEADIIDKKCPLHPTRKLIYQKEKNYFFKLSRFAPEILSEIKSGEYEILPEARKNEVIGRLEQGVQDISISRAGVAWGISVPWNKSQTIYVWVEALFNYYTATQFLVGKKNFWPADLHLIGKDILWFHAVIWPALLLAAKLPLPKQLFAHGFFTIDGQKMSKSLGNVISPKQLVDKYGLDGTRYLLLSAYQFGSDGDLSLPKFDEKYNADLANGLGNLVARVTKLCDTTNLSLPDKELTISSPVAQRIEEYRFNDALGVIWAVIAEANRSFNEDKPWELKGKPLNEVLTKQIIRIGQVATDLQPFLPETSEKILKQFSGKIKSQPPLFPRI